MTPDFAKESPRSGRQVPLRKLKGGLRRMTSLFLSVGFLFLCLMWIGAFSPDTASAKGKLKVATVKFDVQGKIDIPDAGAIVANWLTAALVQNGEFDVKERLSLDEVLSEQAMSQTGIMDPKTAAKVGSIYGVEAIIMGSVVRLDERLPVYISVRMIDTTTGSILKYVQEKAQTLGDLEHAIFSLAEELSGKKTSVVKQTPAPAPIERPSAEIRPRRKPEKPASVTSGTQEESAREPVKTQKASVEVGEMEIRSSPAGAQVYLIDRSKKWLAPYGPSKDWVYLGETPYRNSEMPVGRYWIRVASKSKEEVIAVDIGPGKTSRKMIMFEMIGQGGLGDYGGM